MPPKKKPGKDESTLDDKEQLLRAETEIASLQRLLEIKTHEVGSCTACEVITGCPTTSLAHPKASSQSWRC